MSAPRLLIAGGGTGGHLFPGLAVAEAWQGQGGEVLFVGAEGGLEETLLPRQGHTPVLLKTGKLKGHGLLSRVATLLGVPGAVLKARQVVREFQPEVVLGVGGYASVPAVAAAWLAGIPTALHEQNAHPGLANRWLGRLAGQVLLSFPEAAAAFAPGKSRLTGNPVRAAFLEAAAMVAGQGEGGERPLQLLIFGGSQGARVFSQVVPRAVLEVAAQGGLLTLRQQVRREDVAEVTEIYHQAGIPAQVTPFIHEMAAAYAWADLVICRAGATSLAELTVMGKPALMIPFPFAADDHQTANARSLATAGGGWLQPQTGFTAEWLTAFLLARLADREGLRQVGVRARAQGRPGAADDIVAALLAMSRRS